MIANQPANKINTGDMITGLDSSGHVVVGSMIKSYGFAYAVVTITGDVAVIDGPATHVPRT